MSDDVEMSLDDAIKLFKDVDSNAMRDGIGAHIRKSEVFPMMRLFVAEIDTLRSDLRAAQTVPGDVEVSAAINSLLNYDDEDPQGPYDAKLASLITRLASAERAARERAEKAEAAAQAEVMASGRAVVKMSVEALRNRLVAAESTIATLRAQVDRARGALSSSLSFIESEMRYTQPTYDSGEEPADKFTYDAVPTCMEIRDALSTLEQKP